MRYPTTKEVENATHFQICKWHRFLPSATSLEEARILKQINRKYIAGGGMTSTISKQLGWVK